MVSYFHAMLPLTSVIVHHRSDIKIDRNKEEENNVTETEVGRKPPAEEIPKNNEDLR